MSGGGDFIFDFTVPFALALGLIFIVLGTISGIQDCFAAAREIPRIRTELEEIRRALRDTRPRANEEKKRS